MGVTGRARRFEAQSWAKKTGSRAKHAPGEVRHEGYTKTSSSVCSLTIL